MCVPLQVGTPSVFVRAPGAPPPQNLGAAAGLIPATDSAPGLVAAFARAEAAGFRVPPARLAALGVPAGADERMAARIDEALRRGAADRAGGGGEASERAASAAAPAAVAAAERDAGAAAAAAGGGGGARGDEVQVDDVDDGVVWHTEWHTMWDAEAAAKAGRTVLMPPSQL